jgi:hypothetical protein
MKGDPPINYASAVPRLAFSQGTDFIGLVFDGAGRLAVPAQPKLPHAADFAG